MWWLWIILGCGGSSGPVVSEPTEPTVELGGGGAQTPVRWQAMDGLLPEHGPAFPTALRGLELGQPEARAREVLERAAHPDLPRPPERTLEGTTVVSATLADFPEVGVSLLISGGALQQVDLSLPAAEAPVALSRAWGPAHREEPGNAVVPQPVWEGGGLRATLVVTADGPAILKYTRAEE